MVSEPDSLGARRPCCPRGTSWWLAASSGRSHKAWSNHFAKGAEAENGHGKHHQLIERAREITAAEKG